MHKHAIQIKIGVLSVFEKSKKHKGKKSKTSVSRTTLCTQKLNFAFKIFFCEKCLFE